MCVRVCACVCVCVLERESRRIYEPMSTTCMCLGVCTHGSLSVCVWGGMGESEVISGKK